MAITLDERTSELLERRANERGVTPDWYVRELLERGHGDTAPAEMDPVIAERLEKHWEFGRRVRELYAGREYPPIPDDAFSSESLYGELGFPVEV